MVYIMACIYEVIISHVESFMKKIALHLTV